jgi:stage IV sporulation protein FB
LIKVGGIYFTFHPLFLLVIVLSVVTGYFVEIITLFIIVLIHEMGHLLTAAGFGWKIREVKLLPFGGVMEVENGFGQPARQELWVVLAGPAQNVWMLLVSLLLGKLGLWSAEWTAYIAAANVMIGLFNLLPVLPLDGGRLLHILLGKIMPYRRALLICLRVSSVLSALLTLGSLAPLFMGAGVQLNLLAIGLFLLFTNIHDHRDFPFLYLRFLTTRWAHGTAKLNRGKYADPIVLTENRTLHDALNLFKRDRYHVIVLLNMAGDVLGMLPEQHVLRSATQGSARTLGELL